MAGALSGFGTMAATITGAICAAWIGGTELPAYAHALSAARYEDKELMADFFVPDEIPAPPGTRMKRLRHLG